jgi:hypothetical protein
MKRARLQAEGEAEANRVKLRKMQASYLVPHLIVVFLPSLIYLLLALNNCLQQLGGATMLPSASAAPALSLVDLMPPTSSAAKSDAASSKLASASVTKATKGKAQKAASSPADTHVELDMFAGLSAPKKTQSPPCSPTDSNTSHIPALEHSSKAVDQPQEELILAATGDMFS